MGKIYCNGKGSHEDDPFTFDGPGSESPPDCPKCARAPQYLFGIRIDDMENVGADRTDPRTRDVNLGLGGTFTPTGRGEDGKMKFSYAPCTNKDASSNHRASEIAKRQGLTMLEKRYRSR